MLQAIHLIFLYWYSILLWIHLHSTWQPNESDLILKARHVSGKNKKEKNCLLQQTKSIALCFVSLRLLCDCYGGEDYCQFIGNFNDTTSWKSYWKVSVVRDDRTFYHKLIPCLFIFFIFTDSHRSQSFSCYRERCAGWLRPRRSFSLLSRIRKFLTFGESTERNETCFVFLKIIMRVCKIVAIFTNSREKLFKKHLKHDSHIFIYNDILLLNCVAWREMINVTLPSSLSYHLPLILSQAGKVTFSYIYGIGVLGCLAFYCLLSLMATSLVTLSSVISVLGYSLMPMVVLSGINVLITIQWVDEKIWKKLNEKIKNWFHLFFFSPSTSHHLFVL